MASEARTLIDILRAFFNSDQLSAKKEIPKYYLTMEISLPTEVVFV